MLIVTAYSTEGAAPGPHLGGRDVVLAAFGVDGTERWSISIPGGAGLDDRIEDVVRTPDGGSDPSWGPLQ